MKKTFMLEDLDCANCAAKMENAIRKLEGVREVTVGFLTQKMTIETDEGKMDDVMKRVVEVCRKIEPDCTILLK